MAKEYSFEKLTVWQDSRKLVATNYKLTKMFPSNELFGLTNQMRRASISISSNIAEGSGRTTKADQTNFYKIAYSSMMELLNQLIISKDLDYINDVTLSNMRELIDSIASKLSGLRNSLNTSKP